MLTREVEHPDLSDIWENGFRRNRQITEWHLQKNFAFTGSGKGALALILAYLRHTGIIPDKMHEVAVPGWLGYWVYNQINAFAFPSQSLSRKTRALLVYHQYGFPQDMDRVRDAVSDYHVIIIEDCAHAIASKYKGRYVGGFGDFAIYSFSKFFFCYAFGALRYDDKNFEAYLSRQTHDSSPLLVGLINSAKTLSEYAFKYPNKRFRKWAGYFLNMTYALYGSSFRHSACSLNLFYNKIDREVRIREKRYKYFLGRTNNTGICDHLESDGICPYVIPIRVREKHVHKVVASLKELGLQTGTYQFDMNRFFLEPQFETCVWAFCHSGMSDSLFEKQIDALLRCL